jgi:hypothetical protein
MVNKWIKSYHSFEPLGLTSKYKPFSSAILYGFSVGLALLISTTVKVMGASSLL